MTGRSRSEQLLWSCEPNAGLLRKLTRAAWVVSVLVFSLVVVMGRYKLDIGVALPWLPPAACCFEYPGRDQPGGRRGRGEKQKHHPASSRAIGLRGGVLGVLFLLSYVSLPRHPGGGESMEAKEPCRVVYLANPGQSHPARGSQPALHPDHARHWQPPTTTPVTARWRAGCFRFGSMSRRRVPCVT